jgi:hypothetical protein
MRNARAGSTRNRIFLIPVVLVVAILCTLGWVRWQRILRLGYVDSAIARVRALSSAEAAFSEFHPEVGFTCVISQLPRDQQIARLLKGGVDNGYRFEIVGCKSPEAGRPNSTYRVTARPLHSGLPAFCCDSSGVLRYDVSGSVEKCLATGVPPG